MPQIAMAMLPSELVCPSNVPRPHVVFKLFLSVWLCCVAMPPVCQVSQLVPLRQFTDDPKNNPTQVRFKTLKDRRRFVKETLKLKIVKDLDGQECVPVHDKTLMLSGQRVSAKRTREEEQVDRHASKARFNEVRKAMEVQTNAKA